MRGMRKAVKVQRKREEKKMCDEEPGGDEGRSGERREKRMYKSGFEE